ncbi:riboflavin kinase / FMN adenylyltransferase [Parelusimicrobium proximum]|uniref:bifunctional riboflavin kinase/FAD synthetase n=1 Tax=Parelusimicrobium proximum TaxID=3228953 RepID=UPI003D1703E1
MRFITVGTFDGVHLGHQALFKSLKSLAAEHKMKSCALYFPLPPAALIKGATDMTVLTLPKEKVSLLKEQNLDYIFPLNFKECRNMSAEAFCNMLISKYKMGGLIVGRDFAAGKDREAHIDYLRRFCAANNIVFHVEDFYKDGEHKISSSLVRHALASGRIEEAERLLGRPYSICGKIVAGKRLGRKLGFPTANLEVPHEKILPAGIFATEVILGREVFKGVTNIGFRPTVNTINKNIPLTEVHILKFRRSIYGRKLTVKFISKIRGEKKFDGLPALIAQITADAQTAENIVKL